jgi:hypothetical protein
MFPGMYLNEALHRAVAIDLALICVGVVGIVGLGYLAVWAWKAGRARIARRRAA